MINLAIVLTKLMFLHFVFLTAMSPPRDSGQIEKDLLDVSAVVDRGLTKVGGLEDGYKTVRDASQKKRIQTPLKI